MSARSTGDRASPIRVTHVVFDFNGGGMETLVADMAARFRGSPVSVSLISMSGRIGRLGEATRDRFEQFHVVRPRAGVSMVLPMGVAKLIRQTAPNVVHLHTGSWYKGATAARLAGVRRVIYTEHGREHFDPWRNRLIDRLASYRTDVVVGVSRRLQEYLGSVVRIEPTKLCTVHNGVDTEAFTPGAPPADLRARLGIPEDAVVVGSVGRLEAVKAYERLLEAAAQLRRTLPQPFVIVLGGDGSCRASLEAHAARLGITDIVRFPGWNERPVEFYRLLDVFVLSSISEGQSVSLMEAMACAVAPVVTDVGGNAEMLGADLDECVVRDARVSEGLAKAIAAVTGAPERRAAVGALVRQRAVDHYSVQRMMANYERLYRNEPPSAG
jgi:glycosyltransferase involved in cell wall biosynthesis